MTMTAKEFNAFGVALYGQTSWKSQLAEDLKMNRRTVARLANGEYPVPHGVAVELRAIAAKRAATLHKLLANCSLWPTPKSVLKGMAETLK